MGKSHATYVSLLYLRTSKKWQELTDYFCVSNCGSFTYPRNYCYLGNLFVPYKMIIFTEYTSSEMLNLKKKLNL